MSKEATTKNIYQRLIAVMDDLSYLQKGDKTVNGQYRFVSHDQVTHAIHPLIVKHGIVIVPSVDESQQLGNRTEIKLRVTFINADNGTDFVQSFWTGFGIDNGDKGPGKAISYAYKYAMLKTFCLATGDDPDTEADPIIGISRQQRDELLKALNGDSEILKRMLDAYKIMDLQDLPPNLYDTTLKRILALQQSKQQQQEGPNE